MRVLENGDYQLDDGTIIPKDQISKQHLTASSKKLSPEEGKQELREGQCSGKILLTD